MLGSSHLLSGSFATCYHLETSSFRLSRQEKRLENIAGRSDPQSLFPPPLYLLGETGHLANVGSSVMLDSLDPAREPLES